MSGQKDGVVFQLSSLGNGQALVDRLHNPGLPAIRRISVIGQGTASIAARGIAYLIQQALKHPFHGSEQRQGVRTDQLFTG